ncbi:MAG: LysE family translocator [Deferribacterales bacterium]
MDYSYWLIFFSAAFALCISPGPDLLYIASKTTAQGAKSGVYASAGVCTGAFVHVFAAAFGISAILAASAAAFTAVKIIGALYLFYLGIKALLAKKTEENEEVHIRKTSSGWKTYKQGALIDILNPKVSIFFMAFLPQFVRADHGSTAYQLVYLGFLVILTGFIVELAIIFTLSKATALFRGDGKYAVIAEKVLGMVLIGLGIRLALTTQK